MSNFRRRLLSNIANRQGEGFTVDTNNEWRISSESTPNSSYVLYESFANTGVPNSDDIMYIDINGYSTFTFYIKSYAENMYDYVMVSQLDEDIDGNTDDDDGSLVRDTTRDEETDNDYFDDISYYKQVRFTNIDCQRHRITIVFKKDESNNQYNDRGYVLLPKRDVNAGTIPYITDNYLTIVALEDGLNASLSRNSCEYCIDGSGQWTHLNSGILTPSINAGQTISFRGDLESLIYNTYGIGAFTINKKCNLEGRCASLLNSGTNAASNYDTDYNPVPDYAFYGLFRGCTNIVNISKDFLPKGRYVGDYCYNYMFSGCTNLTTAPELPATTLATYCYAYMFYGCTSLTTAPELPATTLATYCYISMFYGCTGLTTAPELPATTLASNCYTSMFYGCTGLTTAPELPTTTLATYCYNFMFSGCTNLTTAPELPATTLATYCYRYMFQNCTSLTTAPELPATTLASGCYTNMFQNCTSLTTAPELPATTLATYCYSYMFQNCTSLTTAPELPATTLTSNCYADMFYGCTSLTTAPELPAATLATSCYAYMFYGCTNLTTAPELPATTLATYCYRYMFQNCNSLTTAPELRAATLTVYCYAGMFYGCSNLTYIYMLASNISASNCLSGWTTGVASEGDMVLNSAVAGSISTPSGWRLQVLTLSEWVLSSNISNPNSDIYHGVYESFANTGIHSSDDIMYIDIDGYTDFELKIRSYGENNFDYIMVSQLDQTITYSTVYSNTSLVKAHTRGLTTGSNNLSNYTDVLYSGIDGGIHRITVLYRKDGTQSSYDDKGYVIIKKRNNGSNDVILQKINISAGTYSRGSGGTSPITVSALYSNGNIVDVTESCTITITNASVNGVATYNSTNKCIQHGAVGTATLNVSYTEGGIIKTASANIITEVVKPTTLLLNPSILSLATGESATVSLSMPLNNGYTYLGSFEISYINGGENYITTSLSGNTITVTGISSTPSSVPGGYLLVSGTYNGVTITSQLAVAVV